MSLRSRRPTGLLLGGVLAIVAVAFAISALARPDDQTSGTGTGIGQSFRPARDGVCRAGDAASRGDSNGARTAFFDLAHQPLHELAAATQERDRAVTARLLEAKEKVETGLEKSSPTLAADLEVLAVATGRAMAVAGGSDPGPCRG